MKRKTIITSLPNILLAASFLLLTSCAGNMTREEMQSWVDKQPLLEEFPYPHDLYQLDKPTEQEEKGILFKPNIIENGGNFKGTSDIRTYRIVNSKTPWFFPGSIFLKNIKYSSDENIKFALDILNLPDLSGFRPVNYSSVSTNNIKSVMDINIISDNKAALEIKLQDNNIKCHNIMIEGSAKKEMSMGNEYSSYSSSNNFGYKDMVSDQSDQIVSFGEPFMIIPPEKTIKVGDQWERQVYAEEEKDFLYNDIRRYNTTECSICLTTYTLLGYSNVLDKRCAIINSSTDKYFFTEANNGKEKIEKIIKTLSKMSPKAIYDYVWEYNRYVAQSSLKIEGIIAYDYNTGIIVESHSGGYNLTGQGWVGSGVEGVNKQQSIFKLTR